MPAVFTFNGSTVLKVKSWNVSRSRQNGLTWSATLSGPEYWPTGSVGSLFEPYERAEGALTSYVECDLTRGEESYSSPKLAILDVAWDFQPDGLLCELSGTDGFAEYLLFEGVALGDRTSTSDTVYTLHGLLAEVCEACGIATIDVTDLTNHNIPVAHLVGQGLSLIRELTELTQAWWETVGDTLVFHDGGLDADEGGASFAMDESNSKAIQYRKRSTGIYNEATFERVGEHTQLYGPVTQFGFGNQTIVLERPANYALLKVTPYGEGTPENMTWDDASETPITIGPTFLYVGATPTTQVRFSLTPSIAWGEVGMAYLVEVQGRSIVDEVAPFEEEYHSTYVDTADQAIRGRIPFPEPRTSQYCPDQATGAMAAERLVKETLLSYCSLNLDTTMRPTHGPGQKGTVTALKLSLSSKPFVLESVAWSGDGEQEVESMELARSAA